MHRAWLVVGLLIGVVASPAAALGAGTHEGGVEHLVAQDQQPMVVIEYVVQQAPEEDGAVVTATVQIPDTVSRLQLALPADAEVRAVDGFTDDRNDAEWNWDERTANPSITYRISASQNGDDYIDGDGWGIISNDAVGVIANWWYTGESPGFDEKMRFTGNQSSVAGDAMTYFGPYETNSSGPFRLVVPAAADPSVDRDTVFTALRSARNSLTIGARHDDILILVAPSRHVNRSYVPLAGTSEMVVHADSRVNSSNNHWLHEYVHTRQTYETTDQMAWFDEGSADYLAASLAFRQGRARFDAFNAMVAKDRYRSIDLTRPDSWPDENVEYVKGRRVVAALDVRIRVHTDGEKSIQDVLARLNRHGGEVDRAAFHDVVAAVGNESIATSADEWMTGEAPTVPATPLAYVDDPSVDHDGDNLSTAAEVANGSEPFMTDADHDDLDDRRESELGTDPASSDTDGDGLSDGREVEVGADPTDRDTDDDGLGDGEENQTGLDPTDSDTDDDGLGDGQEATISGRNPSVSDATATPTPEYSPDDGRETTETVDRETTPGWKPAVFPLLLTMVGLLLTTRRLLN